MAKYSKHNDNKTFGRLLESPNEALEEIYAQHREVMARSINVLLEMDEETIEEVMACEKPLGWVLKTLQLKALDRARRKRTRGQVPLEEAAGVASGEQADENFRYEELKEQIMEACKVLTDKERTIFLESKFEELTIKELMEKYNMAEQTVKNTQSRAVSKIRKQLKVKSGTTGINI